MCGRETAGRDCGVQRSTFGVRRSAFGVRPNSLYANKTSAANRDDSLTRLSSSSGFRLFTLRHRGVFQFRVLARVAMPHYERRLRNLVLNPAALEKKKNDGRSDGPSSRLKTVLLVTRRKLDEPADWWKPGRVHQELYKHFDRMVLKPFEELLFV
jgi:hypothetical protein